MYRHLFESERRSQHSRLFQKGDIKYVILDFLKDKPSHGYEIMRALEERFHGFYSLSAGSVYPTLQLLEDMGCVILSVRDGKKEYSVTDEGRRFLSEREEIVDRIRGHMRDWSDSGLREEFRETLQELGDVTRLIGRKARQMDDDKLSKIKEIVVRARRDLKNVIGEEE